MAIFFKTLHDMGILSVGVLCFVIFVMECIAVTTSWHVTDLTTCTQLMELNVDANGTSVWVPLVNTTAGDQPDVKLYVSCSCPALYPILPLSLPCYYPHSNHLSYSSLFTLPYPHIPTPTPTPTGTCSRVWACVLSPAIST